MPIPIQKELVIVGGGIAGLWLLNRLCDQGFDAILLEANQLGEGQTIVSQGMIHGGIKYALSGKLNRASNTIAEMPTYWQNCIAGQGDIDLSGTTLLSENYFMWPKPGGLRSRMNAFLGSKSLRGRVTPLESEQFPPFFQGHIKGPLYQLSDIVLDVPSLLDTLSNKYKDRIFKAPSDQTEVAVSDTGDIDSISVKNSRGDSVIIQPGQLILTAGEGTEDLLASIGITHIPMQRRALHMVLLKHTNPDPIYVHCVSEKLSTTPEVTLTTHPCNDGSMAWYLGGELAESGIHRDKDEQVERAKKKLEELFPWYDLSQASWRTFHVNRAEPKQDDGNRPDTAYIKSHGNVMVCWPTKLTLAPALANEVLLELKNKNIIPSVSDQAQLDSRSHSSVDLPFPGIAQPPWETLF